MLYFTKLTFTNYSSINVEDAIRKYSLKRHLSLDFHSSSSAITENKYFLGNENKNDLKITRIRTSFEWLFPKVILSVPKDGHFENLKVRYCLLSTVIFFYLAYVILKNLYFYFMYGEPISDVLGLLILLIIFLAFTYIEIQLTKRKINQAITNFGEI